jgi:hypothetical protein
LAAKTLTAALPMPEDAPVIKSAFRIRHYPFRLAAV